MPEDWRLARLKNIAEKIGSGATPKGGESVYLSTRQRVARIRSQNVFGRSFDEQGLVFISDEHAAQLEGVSVQPDDILLNITGDGITFGRACIVSEKVLPACVNQHVTIIRPDPKACVSGYLLSYLTHPQIKLYIASFNAGGSRRAITKGHIESFDVPLPPLSEQRALTAILGALDDKIELNRRTNHTLEGMARTLFKQWFVDGAEARWEVKPLDEIANYLNGLALQKFPPNDGEESLPVIKISQLRKNNTEGADRASADIDPAYIVNDGDVLFSWSGSLEVSLWCGGKGALNQHLFKVTSEHYPKWFYYLWTREHLPDFQQIAAGKATTMGHIQRHHLSAALAIVPPASKLESMSEQMSPLIERYIQTALQSHTLAMLRDALLPKLISGEVRVRDAEKFIGKAI